jgi:hypothetical protein
MVMALIHKRQGVVGGEQARGLAARWAEIRAHRPRARDPRSVLEAIRAGRGRGVIPLVSAAMASMWLQPITYRGRLVACATATRLFLCEKLEHRPAGDPELTFVLFMCCYARDILTGALPGPYRSEHARRYACAALIPDEVLERPLPDVRRTADALGVPVDELLQARYLAAASEAVARR